MSVLCHGSHYWSIRGIWMTWHSCKVISLFAESLEGSHWALHPPFPFRDLYWQLCKSVGNFSIREGCCAVGRLPNSAVPILRSSYFGECRRVFEEIVAFTSKEMKHRAPDCIVTKKSMVAVLAHTLYIRPLRQLVQTVSEAFPSVLVRLSRNWRHLTAPLQIITTCADFLLAESQTTLWVTESPSLDFP